MNATVSAVQRAGRKISIELREEIKKECQEIITTQTEPTPSHLLPIRVKKWQGWSLCRSKGLKQK